MTPRLEPRRRSGAWRGRLVPWVLSAGLMLSAFTQAGPITAGPTRVDNAYPEQIAFVVDLASSAGAITGAELQIAIRGDTSATILPATLTGDGPVRARVEWNTRRAGIPPGAVYSYQWKVRDDSGHVLMTPSEEQLVLDPRRPWAELADERLGVWWYEGDRQFGSRIFDLASASLSSMEQESGLVLPFRLHVVLYPDGEAFAEWHDYVQDWVGGQAYPAIGLTVQIIPPSGSDRWALSVVCHEVAHLFFHQATYNPLSSGPTTWINEGFAQHHECLEDDWQEEMVGDAMRRGELIPLRLATGSFSGDDERISLLYAESWSAVEFIYARWGEEGMAQLLRALREGADSNDALRQATGLDFEAFQQAWWVWLGGAPGAYPTPPVPATAAPLATPVLPPTAAPTRALTPSSLPPQPEGSTLEIPWRTWVGICACATAGLLLLLTASGVVWRGRRARAQRRDAAAAPGSGSPTPPPSIGAG